MATINVILPDAMTDWIERQTAIGKFGDVSDYVRDLIRRDQEKGGRLAALQRFIDESEASGVSPRSIEDTIAEARRMAEGRGLRE